MRIAVMIASIAFSASTAFAVEMVEGKVAPDGVPVCGGLLGFVCGDKDWCDFPESAACGMSDQFGTCRPRPEVCPKIFMPVCGCDGKTYGNSCEAAASGLDVAYVGACRSEAKPE